MLYGLAAGLSPLLVGGLLCLGILQMQPLWLGLIISGLVLLFALWLGVKIFLKVQKIGWIDFATFSKSSSDLDNLTSTDSLDTKELSAEELCEIINEEKHAFCGGTLRFYGRWFGLPYNNFLRIASASYDKISETLTLKFENAETVILKQPRFIFLSSTYLKILEVAEIQFSWNAEHGQNFFKLILSGNKFGITSNTSLLDKNELYPRKPALLIYA